MQFDASEKNKGVRTHVIILTKDRAETLKRCLDTALASTSADDVITILDDSSDQFAKRNRYSFIANQVVEGTHINYVRSRELFETVTRSIDGEIPLWQNKIAERDIAPLRNLSLLLSVAVAAQTTILIDDDVHRFDVSSTHRCLSENAHLSSGTIAGANIGGLSEQDTITRILAAIDRLCSNSNASCDEVFGASSKCDNRLLRECPWVSGGYLAFRFPIDKLVAFPPGYNEDWLWCLLQQKATVIHEDQVVLHTPPYLRCPTLGDIRFELAGDLVFDCIRDNSFREDSDTLEMLDALSNMTPDSSSLPVARVQELLRLYNEHFNETPVKIIDSHGMRVLSEMERSGELDDLGEQTVREWCKDALDKQQSFASTLNHPSVFDAMRRVFAGGVI